MLSQPTIPASASRHFTSARRLLPMALLFAGLVLGGPSLADDLGTRLLVPNDGGHDCPGQVNEKGDCIITGTNTGN
jgi:hypothetical protein